MLSILTVTLFLFVHALAQDADCDFRQYVDPSTRYTIASPNYPGSYPRSKVCRWMADCPAGYQCRLDCTLELPLTTGCSGDRVLISRTGDPQFYNAQTYCGRQKLTAILSVNQSIGLALITAASSSGGRFICDLTAQAAPQPPQPCSCGVRKQNRIVGGTDAGVNEFPMIAAVFEESVGRILCGAVIIAGSYLVTAAHCLTNQKPSGIQVRVGSRNINSGINFVVESFIIHPYYDPDTFDYDIAILKVSQTMQFNENVSPVCLPFKYINRDLTGANVTLLGWGTLFPGGPTSTILQKVDVQVISQQQCQQTETVTARQICTLTKGKDACQNDSGGPCLLSDPSTGRLFTVGVVSNGVNCASQRPGLNTRVPALLDWIVRNAPANYCNVP